MSKKGFYLLPLLVRYVKLTADVFSSKYFFIVRLSRHSSFAILLTIIPFL